MGGRRGYALIGLYAPVLEVNIGGALRAAHCYEAAGVLIQGRRFSRQPTDTPKTWKNLPVTIVSNIRDSIPYSCVPVAIELVEGARCLTSYTHPERAIYIFGPENGTLGEKVLSYCRDIVQIPTRSCMNLAATVNVVLYDRLVKSRR